MKVIKKTQSFVSCIISNIKENVEKKNNNKENSGKNKNCSGKLFSG